MQLLWLDLSQVRRPRLLAREAGYRVVGGMCPRESCGNAPLQDRPTSRDSPHTLGSLGSIAASGPAFLRALELGFPAGPARPRRPQRRGAALGAPQVLSQLDPRAPPAAPPSGSQLLPRLLRVPVTASSSPAPPSARALSPPRPLLPACSRRNQ